MFFSLPFTPTCSIPFDLSLRFSSFLIFETILFLPPLDLLIALSSMEALNGWIHLNARSSNSDLISCIPILNAKGPYNSIVSLDFLICFDLGKCSIVRMLWRRSQIFTRITLTSFDIANIIFWRLFASLSELLDISSLPNLLTPSTMFATSLPNKSTKFFLVTSQSSKTSCIRAAHIESGSILKSSNIVATARGWVIYFEPSILSWPSWA